MGIRKVKICIRCDKEIDGNEEDTYEVFDLLTNREAYRGTNTFLMHPECIRNYIEKEKAMQI